MWAAQADEITVTLVEAHGSSGIDWVQLAATIGPLLVALTVVVLNGRWADRRLITQDQLGREAKAAEWRRDRIFESGLEFERILQSLDRDSPDLAPGETLDERLDLLERRAYREGDKVMMLLPGIDSEVLAAIEGSADYGRYVAGRKSKPTDVETQQNFAARRVIAAAVEEALQR